MHIVIKGGSIMRNSVKVLWFVEIIAALVLALAIAFTAALHMVGAVTFLLVVLVLQGIVYIVSTFFECLR